MLQLPDLEVSFIFLLQVISLDVLSIPTSETLPLVATSIALSVSDSPLLVDSCGYYLNTRAPSIAKQLHQSQSLKAIL